MPKQIPLTRGYVATIDDDDFDLIRGFRWVVVAGKGLAYATTYSWEADKYISTGMHRMIMGLKRKDGKTIDHIDGNGLNNCRANLRVCTHSENVKNRKVGSNSSTGVKGVTLCRGRYRVRIKVDSVRISIGHFDTVEQAFDAYKAAAIRLHGEFACVGDRAKRDA